MKTNAKGISLIVLVITVVVLSILAGVTVFIISGVDIIGIATQTVTESDINNITNAADLAYKNLMIENFGDSKGITEDIIKQRMIEDGIRENDLENINIQLGEEIKIGLKQTITSNSTVENPVNSAVKYRIYGNSIQNGTPSPSAPVEIQSVGDRTNNLFDISNVQNGTMNGDTGVHVPGMKNRCISDYILVEQGTYCYTLANGIKAGKTHFFAKKDETTRTGGVMPTVSLDGDKVICTFTVPSDCYIRTVFLPVDETAITNLNTEMLKSITITLNAGGETLDYEPYGYKIPITVTNNNKTKLIIYI